MSLFIFRRVLQSVFVIFLMSVIVFVGVNVVGDPVDLLVNPESGQEEVERVIRELGLDRPVHEQYFVFLGNALKGDFGKSFVFGRPALRLMAERFPATLELAITALMFAVLIGLPLGVYAGLRPESRISRTIMAGSILGFSLPTFWVGIMMIMIFAVVLGWLPSTGRGETVPFMGIQVSLFTWDGFKHLLMPALNLSLFKISLVIRLARAGTREVMLQDYIKFARAKGLSRQRIVGVHLLKNILIPIVTVVGLEFGNLIAFSTVTETVFSWPGMGKLIIEAIINLDRPLVVAYMMFVVSVFVILNLIVDLLYSVLDPRVRLQDIAQ